MGRLAVQIVALWLTTFVAGCVKLPSSTSACGYSALAHPTMTADAISVGLDSHVRAVSEGATGGVGD